MSIIRKATVNDISAIKIINEECLTENYSYGLWYYFFETGNVYVVEEIGCFRKNIVGYILSIPYTPILSFGTVTNDFLKDNTNYNLIASFAVLETHRKQGYGQQLMTKLLNDIGDKLVLLHVRVSNLGAIKLYEKNNFIKHTLIDEKYYEDPCEDAYLMYRQSTNI